MSLKNAYSHMPINRIFSRLESTLSKHQARSVIHEYDQGRVTAIIFNISVGDKKLSIKLPARIDKAAKLLREQGFRYSEDQVYRVAWRNILDWVDSQMALIDIEMVQIEEVFLPYVLVSKNTTMFEAMEKSNYQLPSGV